MKYWNTIVGQWQDAQDFEMVSVPDHPDLKFAAMKINGYWRFTEASTGFGIGKPCSKKDVCIYDAVQKLRGVSTEHIKAGIEKAKAIIALGALGIPVTTATAPSTGSISFTAATP